MAVARVTTVVASSPSSWEEAASIAVDRASKTLRGITGAEVLSQKAKVQDGKISEYRIEVKITFILES